MKRTYLLLVFFAGIAVINGYGLGSNEQTADAASSERTELSERIDELAREQKTLKDELENNKKDMEGLSRKLDSFTTSQYIDDEIAQAFEGYDDQFDDEQFNEDQIDSGQLSDNQFNDEQLFNDDQPDETQAVALNIEIEEDANDAVAEDDNEDESAVAAINDTDTGTMDTDDGVPEIPKKIILAAGQNGYLTEEAVVDFIKKYSRPPSWFESRDIEALVKAYFREAKNERVNPDIALAQMWYATLSLTHYALLKNCNYANLEPVKGVEGIQSWNGVFPNIDTGVKAHIQHLKGYASSERPGSIADPRYEILVKYGYLGKGDTISKLSAMWTKNTEKYESTLNEILTAMYQHQYDFMK